MKTHQTCPECEHNDCYTIFDDGGGKCHSCSYKRGPNKHKTKDRTHMKDLNETYTKHRGVDKDVNEFYGVVTGTDSDGVEKYRKYPYPTGTKKRILPKDFSDNAGFKGDKLFGMDKFNAGSSKFITIVEGEEDVLSAYQMLGKKHVVVGLPSASISKKLMKDCFEYINSFENVVVCTDSDDAGRSATLKLAEAFPNKVYTVSMTKHKDPNEFLVSGKTKDFMYAWVNRTKFVPEFDTSTPDAYKALYDDAKDSSYLPSGLSGFDEHHLGLFQGHFTVFQAKEGVGKTELFRFFEHHLIKNYRSVPFAMCHLEESQLRSLMGVVSYDLNKNVTRKELVEDEGEVKDSITRLTESENVHLFSIGVDEDPLVLIERIKYYANVCGCKYIFIEPIQDIAHQRVGTETTEQFLTKLSVLLSRTAAETGCGIITIAHENDDGAIRDCRMIGKQASAVFRLTRDVNSESEEVRNTTTITSLKNRPSAFVGFAGQLSFDVNSFTISEKL